MAGQRPVPLISAVIPTYNRSTLLSSCLYSIEQQSLSGSAFEVIVVDDGSTDDTADVCTKIDRETTLRLSYIRGVHRGPAAARNQGIRSARGSIVAFIDDDCVAQPTWLEEILRPFSSESVVGVEGLVVRHPECTPFTHFVENLHGGFFLTANVAYRREAIAELGGFDESYGHAAAEDWDLAFRVLESGGRIVFCPEAIVIHEPVPINGKDFMNRVKDRRSAIQLYDRFPELWKRTTGRSMRQSILEGIFFGPVVEARKWRHYFRIHLSELPRYLFWQTLASARLMVEHIRLTGGNRT